jgi:ABC-type phosphate transport system substrate-binding protein
MKPWVLIITLIFLAACSKQEEPNTTRGSLFMLATETYLPLLNKEADEFMTEYDRTHVTIAGTTTREAIVALVNDSVRCICIDRSLNPEERKVVQEAGMNLSTIRIGKDALVLIVSDQDSLKSITMETLRGIADKSVTDWKRIPDSHRSGKLEVVTTGLNTGVPELLQRRFFHLDKEFVPTMTGTTEKQIVQYIKDTPQGIGIVSFASVLDHPKGIHILGLGIKDSTSRSQIVEPNQANIFHDLYPLTYSLYLYISEPKLAVGSGFGTFIMTIQGQQIIQDYGLAPEIVPSRVIQLTSE